MQMYSWKFVASSVLTTVMLAVASASAQTSKRPAPHRPKAQPAAEAQSPGEKAAATPLTPRGVQRGKFTPEDKATFEKETRTAIIVAPSYRDSGLASLRYTFADAVELKSELERQGYHVHMIPSTEATADGIRQALVNQKTFLDGTTQATLVFAFMGHGFDNGKGKNYLMTYGADLNNMDKEALSLDEVEQLINSSGARRKLIFIDACRNVPGTRDAAAPRTMAEFKAAEGTAILLATKPGAFSYEDPELSHGVFTYFLLQGLRGKAAGKDGYITFHDLSDYVGHSVLDYSMKKDQAQKPLATLQDVGGDFLVATAAAPRPDEIKPNPAASQITSDAVVMRPVGANTINRSFFANLNEGSLTLLDASTAQPYAMLSEHPDQLKDQKETGARSLRWFAGSGPDNTVIQMVAEMRGNDVFQLWGRVGKPCSNDLPCSTSPYPLLPGEVRDKKADMVKKGKKFADMVRQTTGRGGEAVDTVSRGSTALDRSGLAADSRDKFIWTNLNLTRAQKPGQPTTQAQR